MPIVHFDDSGFVGGSSDGLYVQFDNSAGTNLNGRVALTEGTGDKVGRYEASDSAIATVIGSGTFSNLNFRVRRGNINAHTSADEVRGVGGDFNFVAGAEVSPSANVTHWKGAVATSMTAQGMFPADMVYLNGNVLSGITLIGTNNFVTYINNAGGVSSTLIGTGSSFPLSGADLTRFNNFWADATALGNFDVYFSNSGGTTTKILDNSVQLSGAALTAFNNFFAANTGPYDIDDVVLFATGSTHRTNLTNFCSVNSDNRTIKGLYDASAFPLTGTPLTNFNDYYGDTAALDNFDVFFSNGGGVTTKIVDDVGGEGSFPLTGTPLANFEQFYSDNTGDRTIDSLYAASAFPLTGTALTNFSVLFTNGSVLSTLTLSQIPEGIPLSATGKDNFATFFENDDALTSNTINDVTVPVDLTID